MARVNTENILRWDDGTTSTAQPDLPRPYEKDKGGCPFMPILYPSESMAFVINSPTGVVDNTGGTVTLNSDLRLDIVRASDNVTVSTNLALLNYVSLDTNIENIYCTFVVPTLTNGMYYFKILNTGIVGNPVLLTSSYVLVRNDKSRLDKETVLVKFRHDRWFYHIPYNLIPGFYQQFRLTISEIDRQVESDVEEYKAVTTGRIRQYQNYLSRAVKFEAYYLDREGHDAMAVLVQHDYIEINGKEYTTKGAYKVETNVLSKYAKGSWEAYQADFSSVNRC